MLEPKLIEILEELFAIGGNHDTVKTFSIRKKLIDFMIDHNLFLKDSDKNFIMIKDTIRFIDAHTNLATTTNRNEASTCLKPFFKRLNEMQPDDWNYYELHLLISSLHLVDKVKQALDLGTKSIIAIAKFEDINNVDLLESCVACNICYRILYAKYFDNIKMDLTNHFETWFKKLENLAKEDSKIELDFLVTKIRQALFYQNRKLIRELLDELKTKYDEKIFDIVSKEVGTYYIKFDPRHEGGER